MYRERAKERISRSNTGNRTQPISRAGNARRNQITHLREHRNENTTYTTHRTSQARSTPSRDAQRRQVHKSTYIECRDVDDVSGSGATTQTSPQTRKWREFGIRFECVCVHTIPYIPYMCSAVALLVLPLRARVLYEGKTW